MTDSPIGVFDSGVGGLSVLREMLRRMPGERFIYLGDSARVPYGSKSPETVQLFARQCTDYLLGQAVKLVVVACNSASAVALDVVRQASPVPVIGVIAPAAAAAVAASRSGHIGVIGTRATIDSGAYVNAMRRMAPHVTIHSQPCPLFVPCVEEGWIDHPATRLIAAEYLDRLFAGGAPIDTLVLGCTHYPLLKPLLADLRPGCALVDCGEHAAGVACAVLAARASVRNGAGVAPGPRVRFCLTDVPPTFVPIAERFLGFPVAGVERVAIDHLCQSPHPAPTSPTPQP